ncbi:MAG: hypothetical protein RLZZ71_1555 [Bacteroidota bacterium]
MEERLLFENFFARIDVNEIYLLISLIMENKNTSSTASVNPLQDELNEVKAQKEKLERELLAREELMQSMFSLLAEKKK